MTLNRSERLGFIMNYKGLNREYVDFVKSSWIIGKKICQETDYVVGMVNDEFVFASECRHVSNHYYGIVSKYKKPAKKKNRAVRRTTDYWKNNQIADEDIAF